MFALLIKPEVQIPVIVNEEKPDFADYLMAGYEIISEGSKKLLEAIEEEMMEQYRIY